MNGDGAEAKDGVASKQGESVGTAYLYECLYTAAAAAGSNRHGQEVLLPCKPSARMDKGLAHRPRLAGNLDTKEGNGWREDPRQWATGQAAQLTGVEMCMPEHVAKLGVECYSAQSTL
ncbi:uncharacterized protein TrAtP1_000216 [Trichoderma atroviride]|uniref:uncharacterized protein n=1 Tax=Hypocrea atroviridis TaxID=63577 RepID=UPI003322397B|nr:hypothetical protein TrAtP1_000216 [Trichoderma atroviride]